ncbi:MAG: hypothetical protein WCI11_16345 [Candidatus Methylumidiphilus sp.]
MTAIDTFKPCMDGDLVTHQKEERRVILEVASKVRDLPVVKVLDRRLGCFG